MVTTNIATTAVARSAVTVVARATGNKVTTGGYHSNGGWDNKDNDDSKGNSGENGERNSNNRGSASHICFFRAHYTVTRFVFVLDI